MSDSLSHLPSTVRGEHSLIAVQSAPWQRCPICGGKGTVPRDFYAEHGWADQSTSVQRPTCRSCNGRGIVR